MEYPNPDKIRPNINATKNEPALPCCGITVLVAICYKLLACLSEVLLSNWLSPILYSLAWIFYLLFRNFISMLSTHVCIGDIILKL